MVDKHKGVTLLDQNMKVYEKPWRRGLDIVKIDRVLV